MSPAEAHKRLMAQLPVRTHTRRRVMVRGREYPSMKLASDAENLPMTTMRRWIKRGLVTFVKDRP